MVSQYVDLYCLFSLALLLPSLHFSPSFPPAPSIFLPTAREPGGLSGACARDRDGVVGFWEGGREGGRQAGRG
jgi:hypothetical protein